MRREIFVYSLAESGCREEGEQQSSTSTKTKKQHYLIGTIEIGKGTDSAWERKGRASLDGSSSLFVLSLSLVLVGLLPVQYGPRITVSPERAVFS